ncbi:hypothetical protein EWM64_g532 [Hericium alpestre]|uniref:C3H1-type domain-containing protein n=1 Tax=Hericium alpestre TaxID=135208 RepID=A0A4Z0AAX3_9AGAM|nr:hypothetical protein EWM64_g532 [Hericium alpestre]
MIGRKLYSTQFPSHSDVPHLSSCKTAGPPGQDQWARAPYTYYQSMMANSPAPAGYRHLSHKTALCKHFTRTKGYCPMGEMCNFIHDLSLCGIPDERSHSTPGSSGSVPGTGSSQKKTTHCWAFVHGLCKLVDCPYVHPADTAPYLKHTPCLAWPACFHGAGCRFKHPEPLPSPLPVVHTGYLPGARNQSPAPASSVSPLPAQPSYNVAPEPFSNFELRYERALNAPSPVSPRAIVAPMSLDQALASETAPPSASTRKSAVQKRKTLPPSLRIITAVPAKKEAAQEFPHTPTVTSTAMTHKGHARRISVSVKTELETVTNASPNTPVAYVKRQSWAAFSAGDRHSNGFPC